MPVPLLELVSFLDGLLQTRQVADEAHAVNGLQLEASTEVVRVALAVDASEAVIEEATDRQAELLFVHHGLFWSGLKPLAGPLGRKIGRCFRAGTSVYSAHAPLDVHPELGNNVGLMFALGLTPDGKFGNYAGTEIGLTASCDWSASELAEKARAALGEARIFGAGPERIRRLGVITGGAGSFVGAAARAGLDALVTGEGAHYTAIDAEERGLHLVMGGHWRTETFGVKAVGRRLEERFGLDTFFIGRDTGL